MLGKLVLLHQYFHYYSVIIYELIAVTSGPNNISKLFARSLFHGAEMKRVYIYAVKIFIVCKNSCSFVKPHSQFSIKSIGKNFETVSAFLMWNISLREKCPYSQFFLSVFSRIREKKGTKKLPIWTLFLQCLLPVGFNFQIITCKNCNKKWVTELFWNQIHSSLQY